MEIRCDCDRPIEGATEDELADVFLAHVRADHQDWPFPDGAVRNYAAAKLRLTGPSERLEALGAVEVHPVTEERLDDWTSFFDHDGFVGTPEWASCYCTEPHLLDPKATAATEESRPWRQNRATMQDLLRTGRAEGYLAYVDGRPAGWVNASKRSSYALFRQDDGEDGDVVGLSCFVIAPPYRRHGLAGRLLDRVIADAPGRGVSWIEAYPFTSAVRAVDDKNFRGPRSLYDARGFEVVEERERYVVMRRATRAGTP
jgi:GNAT superfamily N-acetyltransferase